MALLVFNDLTEVCKRAIAAGLATERDVLFIGISEEIKAAVRSATNPADALKIEVDRLNNYVDRTATDGYLLGIWLLNAADKLGATRAVDSQFFRDWATTVNAVAPAIPATPATTAAIIPDARAQEQTNAAVKQAVLYMRSAMPDVNRRATNLMVSKRLHDTLHHIQLSILPLWSSGVAALASAPDFARNTVQDRQRALKTQAENIASESAFLSAGEPLLIAAQKTSADLLEAASDAEAALSADDITALKAALAKVRNIVKNDMPVYANKMEVNQEGLDLSRLLANLLHMAEGSADAAFTASVNRMASALAAIIQDLNQIGPQHGQWQLLDVRMGALEDLFGFLPMGQGIYSSFDLQWESVNAAIEMLASQPPADRFDRIRAVRDKFLAACPMPVQGPPTDPAARQFGDFVIEVRTVFLAVDQRMKNICNQLREITSQLATL